VSVTLVKNILSFSLKAVQKSVMFNITEEGRGTSPGHMISHQHQDDTLYWNKGILGHFQLTSSQLSFSISWWLTFNSHSCFFHNPRFLLPSFAQHGSYHL